MKRHYATEQVQTVYAATERLEACNHICWIEPQETWDSRGRNPYKCPKCDAFLARSEASQCRTCGYVILPTPPELSTTWGDWSELKDASPITPNTFVLIEYCTGSDYCNSSLVEVSNHKALKELCDAAMMEDGVDYLDYSGGYGTFGLAVRVEALGRADENGWLAAILEAIEGLEDYPLLDEDLHSQLEIESQNEAWESDIKQDFERELGKYFAAWFEANTDNSYTEALMEFATDDDWAPQDKLAGWFYQLADYANEYWVNESGSGSWIDVEDIVKNGFGRKLEHWPEGAKKRDELEVEIRRTLEHAYVRACMDAAMIDPIQVLALEHLGMMHLAE